MIETSYVWFLRAKACAVIFIGLSASSGKKQFVGKNIKI